VLSQHQRQRE
jgi:hypothetical protein